MQKLNQWWQRVRIAPRRELVYQTFLYLVVLSGIVLNVVALSLSPSYQPLTNFLLLLALAALSETATTSIRVSDKAGITFGVGTAVAISAVPAFGPMAAILTVTITNFGIWLLKPKDSTTWKKNWIQLGFNTGMHSISMLVAGNIFTIVTTNISAPSFIVQAIAWLVTAAVYDQLNFWLLMTILRLQHGPKFSVLNPWRENMWAIPINILVMSIGGGLLAYAMVRFDWLGIVIFYVPIFLTAYAFRLYVHQMQEHMDRLEEIVDTRTQELLRQKNELEELNRQKDVYLSVLSHDIKTSLAGVSVYVSLMQDYPQIILEDESIVDDIFQSLRMVNNIVEDIVDLDRLDLMEINDVDLEEFQLDKAIYNITNTVRSQALKKNLLVKVLPPAEPIWIEADRQRVERIFLNLLSNAIKYTPKQGRVTLKMHQTHSEAVVEVQDTGYGIPDKDLPYIFDRYHRVQGAKYRAAGSGLGLTIAKVFVEAHGGTINVTSNEDEGSVFTIKLPLHPKMGVEEQTKQISVS
jgi:signal transduction histidine kinase